MVLNKLQRKWSGPILELCTMTAGVIAIVFLLQLIREFVVVCWPQDVVYGLVLAVWLLAFGYGMRLHKRFVQKDTLSLLLFTQLLCIPVLLVSLTWVRLAPVLSGIPIGTEFPFLYFLCYVIVTVTPPAALSGLQLALLNQLHTEKNREYPRQLNKVLRLFILGGAGGAAILTVLNAFFSMQYLIIVMMTLMVWACIAAIVTLLIPPDDAQHRKFWGTIAVLSLFLFSLLLFSPISGQLDKWSQKTIWSKNQVLKVRESAHGRLSFTREQHQLAAYQGRVPLFDTAQKLAAEEQAHIPMLATAQLPQQVLIIGGGLGGVLEEHIKYSTLARVDYLEIDHVLLSQSRTYLLHNNFFSDKRFQIWPYEARHALAFRTNQFDLIEIGIPYPASLGSNRYVSAEFLISCKQRLSPSGVLAVRLPLEPTGQRQMLSGSSRSLITGIKNIFPHAIIIYGVSNNFCLASSATEDPFFGLSGAVLAERMTAQLINNSKYTPFIVQNSLTMGSFQNVQDIAAAGIADHDRAPEAYIQDLGRWLSPGFPIFASIRSPIGTAVVYIICILGLLYILSKRTFAATKAALSHSTALLLGAVCLLLQILLLYGFQSLFGVLYLIVNAMMVMFLIGIYRGASITAEQLRTNKSMKPVLVRSAGVALITAVGLLVLATIQLPELPVWLYYIGFVAISAGAGYPIGRAYAVLVANLVGQIKGEHASTTAAMLLRTLARGAAIAVLAGTLILIPVIGLLGTTLISIGSIVTLIILSL